MTCRVTSKGLLTPTITFLQGYVSGVVDSSQTTHVRKCMVTSSILCFRIRARLCRRRCLVVLTTILPSKPSLIKASSPHGKKTTLLLYSSAAPTR